MSKSLRARRPDRARSSLTGIGLALAAVAVIASGAGAVAPAAAHDYAATVYAALSEPEPGVVRAELDLEYALLTTDGARAMGDVQLEQEASDALQTSATGAAAELVRVLEQHSATVEGYVLPRFAIAVEDGMDAAACPSEIVEPYSITFPGGDPHAHLVLETDCRTAAGVGGEAFRVTTALFPGGEPGGQTTTVVTYDLDGGAGVASLDTDTNPTMVTTQDWGSRMGEFFVLGAEHLLFGLDHILFLLALIVASRRLRDIVVVATAFTVAHSVTFILAALGVVSVPAIIVEPVIALSIAVVALWYLWGQWRTRGVTAGHPSAAALDVTGFRPVPRGSGGGTALLERAPVLVVPAPDAGTAGFTKADWLRVGVVFAFGLVHGIGFAGALGIEEQFSWGLLGALLVFNLGIEAAQLTIIAVTFPLLALLRRRSPQVGLWVAVVVSAGVASVGLFWFVERLLGA